MEKSYGVGKREALAAEEKEGTVFGRKKGTCHDSPLGGRHPAAQKVSLAEVGNAGII